MTNRLVAFGFAAIVMAAIAAPAPRAAGQAGAQPPAPRPSVTPSATPSQPAAPSSNAPPSTGAAAQRALVDRYCVGCHNQRGKAAGQEPARKLTLDDLDIAHVSDHAEAWERVVRKMRAGMMPPAGVRRPDKAT